MAWMQVEAVHLGVEPAGLARPRMMEAHNAHFLVLNHEQNAIQVPSGEQVLPAHPPDFDGSSEKVMGEQRPVRDAPRFGVSLTNR